MRLVRELLDYDPETGVFRWRVSRTGQCAKAGDIAGCRNSLGYWRLKLGGKSYLAHRIAWMHVHGNWPVGDIDHIDGDRLNNQISNLRDVCRSVNKQNLKRANRDNKTSLLGVSPCGDKYRAQIRLNGKSHFLGTFPTAPEAHEAYLIAKRELHEGNTL